MGGMKDADIIIGGIKDGKPYFADYHAKGKQTPDVDASQDWTLLSASENSTHTTLKVTRVFNTCDDEDVPISNDTTKIIWAIGATDDIVQHRKRGAASANILDSAAGTWNGPESEIWHINVKTKLPANDTIYWCTAHKSPDYDVKRHVVGFQYMYGWAVGGDPLILPENIGIPLNEFGLPEYFLLEVHYDNPKKLVDLHYSTGVEVYTTPRLRKHEAGIIRMGYETDIGLMIPPNSSNYIIAGHCSGTCTENRLPEEGIKVFTLILHSHLAGRKMKLRQFRNGVELPWWAYDNNYDFNFQQNRILPEHKQIFKGDHLTFECTDDSSDRSPPEAILGGLSTRREMCLAFVMYYPRISTLNNCGSHFGERATLLTKLGIEKMQPIDSATKVEVQNLTRFGEHLENCEPQTQNDVIKQVKVSYPEFKPYIPKNECDEDPIIKEKH
ncbi:unnamed protein product [Allacma fusca]|uniref:DOMON domain-containing protein n=1 Tax=Allacma fusca TaxID=39272 RepID=A0A8J2L7L5_9HEXA|nr:unnamed protein product [Allacma fusca]